MVTGPKLKGCSPAALSHPPPPNPTGPVWRSSVCQEASNGPHPTRSLVPQKPSLSMCPSVCLGGLAARIWVACEEEKEPKWREIFFLSRDDFSLCHRVSNVSPMTRQPESALPPDVFRSRRLLFQCIWCGFNLNCVKHWLMDFTNEGVGGRKTKKAFY